LSPLRRRRGASPIVWSRLRVAPSHRRRLTRFGANAASGCVMRSVSRLFLRRPLKSNAIPVCPQSTFEPLIQQKADDGGGDANYPTNADGFSRVPNSSPALSLPRKNKNPPMTRRAGASMTPFMEMETSSSWREAASSGEMTERYASAPPPMNMKKPIQRIFLTGGCGLLLVEVFTRVRMA